MSALSFVEQGYDRESADRAAAEVEAERRRVGAELDRLNAAYEARFGFRYCVFVAGRSRAALLPGFEAALTPTDRRRSPARSTRSSTSPRIAGEVRSGQEPHDAA